MAENTTATTTTDTQTVANTSTQTAAQTSAATQATATQSATETSTNQDTKQTNFEELVQKAVDRATNKLGNENKKLREEMDKLKKEKLSDEELKKLEMQEKEKEIAEREQRLLEKENRLTAIKAIKEAGLDDGSDLSLSLVDFVMGDDESAITEKVKTFKTLVDRFVQANVDKVFKANGRAPGKSATGTGDTEKKDSVAVRMGQKTAEANKAAQNTLNYYIGGNKK